MEKAWAKTVTDGLSQHQTGCIGFSDLVPHDLKEGTEPHDFYLRKEPRQIRILFFFFLVFGLGRTSCIWKTSQGHLIQKKKQTSRAHFKGHPKGI